MNALTKRLLVGFIYLLISLAVIIFNIKELAYLFVSVIMIGGTYEYFRAIKLEKTFLEYFGYILSVFALAVVYLYDNTEITKYTAGMLVLVVNFLGIMNILKVMKYKITDISLAILGYIYIILFPIYILKIFGMQYGNLYIGLLFTIVIATDSWGWLIGKHFGKRKISKISPNKTYEGAIGGIIASVVFGIIYIYLAAHLANISLNMNYQLLIPVIMLISIHAQFGDFFASMIKRNFGIKDFSNALGEHGGVIDRADSLIFVSLITYYILQISALKLFV